LNVPIKNFSLYPDNFLKAIKENLSKIINEEHYIKVLVEVNHYGKGFIFRLIGNYKHNK
jgi:hypothetical protein